MFEIQESEPFEEETNFGFYLESRYFLNNMGTLLIFYLVYPMLVLTQLCFYVCKRFSKCADSANRWLKSRLYFKMPLTVIFESHCLVMFSCSIAASTIEFESWGLTVQSVACLAFAMIFLTLPFFLLGYLAKNLNELEDSNTKRRFGDLYEGLEIRRGPSVFLWPSIFLLRRIMIICTIVYSSNIMLQVYTVWL